MDEKYPVSVLSSHPEIGDLSLADCYPQIVEHGTEQNKHEVPRIVFRACLPPRLKDGEIFNFVSVNMTNETVDGAKEKLKTMAFMPDSLYYIYVGQYKTLKTPVKTIFSDCGFVPNDIVNKFFDGRIEKQEYKNEGDFIQSYYNEEKKIAVVVGSIISEYFWNVCAAVCPRIIPWYFNVTPDFTLDKHPLTEDERELVRAIDIGDTAFIAATQKIYDKTDVAEKVQATKFRNMYRGVREKLIKNCNDTILQLNREFESLEKQIQERAYKIRDAVMQKQALESGKDDDGSALTKLFSRPNIAVKEWQGDDLLFTAVSDHVVPFDMDCAEEYFADLENAIYSGCHDLKREEARKLLVATFIDAEIRFPVYTNFKLSLKNTKLEVVQHSTPAPKFSAYVPHPHHEYYNCTGNNMTRAANYLKEGNYAGAVNQAIGSVGTITLDDSWVMGDFGSKLLWKKNETPFLLPDGKKVNFIDAYKWLKEREG